MSKVIVCYRLVSGDVKYTAERARRKLLQMPLDATVPPA